MIPAISAYKAAKSRNERAFILYHDLRNRRAQHQKRQAKAAELRAQLEADVSKESPVDAKKAAQREQALAALAKGRETQRAKREAARAAKSQDG